MLTLLKSQCSADTNKINCIMPTLKNYVLFNGKKRLIITAKNHHQRLYRIYRICQVTCLPLKILKINEEQKRIIFHLRIIFVLPYSTGQGSQKLVHTLP